MFEKLKRRLFRWQSDGIAPLRLTQRRIYILPTRAGLLFAVMLLAMLTGAINYNLALGHALVFLLFGLAMSGLVHTFRNLHGLSISPGRCAPCYAGEQALFPLILSNDSERPRPALALIARGMVIPATCDLPPGEVQSVPIGLPAAQRGWLPLPRVRLETTYPLGLFVAWSYLQPEMRCLIYPRPELTPLPPETAVDAAGEYQGDLGQEDFSGFRQRQPADPLRHVAWKASARNGGQGPLLVKLFSGGAASELRLDWLATPWHAPTETRIAVLAGWVVQAAAERRRFSLHLPAQEIPAGEGDAQLHRCLEALALFEP